MSIKNQSTIPSDKPHLTYETAPTSPRLNGIPVSSRQLRRAVELGRIGYTKFGNRVLFSDDNLSEWLERATVRPVR